MSFNDRLEAGRQRALALRRETLRLIEAQEQRAALEVDADELERQDRIHRQTAGAI